MTCDNCKGKHENCWSTSAPYSNSVTAASNFMTSSTASSNMIVLTMAACVCKCHKLKPKELRAKMADELMDAVIAIVDRYGYGAGGGCDPNYDKNSLKLHFVISPKPKQRKKQ